MARDRIDVEPDLPTIANTPALKAAGFNSLTSVLRSMASDADFQRFTEALPPGSREAVSCPPLAVTWVPLTDAAPIWEAAYEHLFARNDERMFELGRLQLRTDMLGIFRLVLRVATPAFVASRTGEIYASSAGSSSSTLHGSGAAVSAPLPGRERTVKRRLIAAWWCVAVRCGSAHALLVHRAHSRIASVGVPQRMPSMATAPAPA